MAFDLLSMKFFQFLCCVAFQFGMLSFADSDVDSGWSCMTVSEGTNFSGWETPLWELLHPSVICSKI